MSNHERHADHPMRTASREFCDACVLSTTVRTTGYRGGDSGHGGRTEIVFEDRGGTDISAGCTDGGGRKVTIRLGGDAELRLIIAALRFAADSLERLSEPDAAKADPPPPTRTRASCRPPFRMG